jgi:hypothetical protein
LLEFYSPLHEYRDGDTIVKSVTQILKSAGYIDDRWYKPGSAERGSAVHEFCDQYAQGKRIDGVGRQLNGLEYVNAFASWMRKTGAYAIDVETMIDNTIDGFRYCGRYDLLAEIQQRRVLVDIKTGAAQSWHVIQMAAYAMAVDPQRIMVLYLKPDGRYKERYIAPVELITGISTWRSALIRAREVIDAQEKSAETNMILNRSWF